LGKGVKARVRRPVWGWVREKVKKTVWEKG